MTSAVEELRREIEAAIDLVELCGQPDAADWFREKDRILASPDVNGSHLAAAKMLAASAAGMGRPLEAIYPAPNSGLSYQEMQRRRSLIIDSMWQISLRMATSEAP